MSLKSIASSLLSEGRGVIATERACVAGYLAVKSIHLPRKSYLKTYLTDVDEKLARKCHDAFKPLASEIDLETLIELFELLMAGDARKKNGVAYTPLSRYVIRNGLATLANNVYFFKPNGEDERYFYRTYEGSEWKIENPFADMS